MKRLGAWGGWWTVAFVATAVACATGADETGAGLGGGTTDGGSDGSVSLPEGGVAPSDGGSSSGRPDGSSGGTECTDKVVINELMTAGTTKANEEFVELFNPNDCEVSLAGHALRYKSADGNGPELVAFASNEKVPAKGFLLVATTDFAGAKDVTMAAGLAGGGGSVGLVKGNTTIDAVAWGNATQGYLEGPRAPAPIGGDSIARKTDGVDTNDNKADFEEDSSPTPGAPN